MRRISARAPAAVRASKAQVARLAPPVSTRRSDDRDLAQLRREHIDEGRGQSRRVGHLRPNFSMRCATRRIWISSAPSVIRYRRWWR